jgi:hypothetical protein
VRHQLVEGDKVELVAVRSTKKEEEKMPSFANETRFYLLFSKEDGIFYSTKKIPSFF